MLQQKIMKKYQKGTFKNIFKILDDKASLWLIGFCLAVNDILLCREAMDKHEDEEKEYYFATALSILRELAKIVNFVEETNIKTYFSEYTNRLFITLESDLKPFEVNSLTKGTLKPIRDYTFHYNYLELKQDDYNKLRPFLEQLKNDSELSVRINPKDSSIMRHRYTFADFFRRKYVNSLLSGNLVSKIVDVTGSAVGFTDSILYDLSKKL